MQESPRPFRFYLAVLWILSLVLTGLYFATDADGATTQRHTIVLSPHQDDELVRLSDYTVIASDRGDSMELIQVTNGSATSVGRKLGLTTSQTTHLRNREQSQAWEWLTDGRGDITYLNLQDGAARSDDIYNKMRSHLGEGTLPGTEIYVATWHYDRRGTVDADKHPDHKATVDAAMRLQQEGVVVRFAVHPTSTKSGYTYNTNTILQNLRVEGAVESYGIIGNRSSPNIKLPLTTPSRVTR